MKLKDETKDYIVQWLMLFASYMILKELIDFTWYEFGAWFGLYYSVENKIKILHIEDRMDKKEK